LRNNKKQHELFIGAYDLHIKKLFKFANSFSIQCAYLSLLIALITTISISKYFAY